MESFIAHLVQKSRTGKTKQLKIWVDQGSNLIRREHGFVDGKQQQPYPKEVQGKNIGKTNETTPNQQAVKEAEAIVAKKEHEGYVNIKDFDETADIKT